MANMFNEDGTYNKTEWKAGDRITAAKLNKIELSLEAINNNDIDRHVEADSRLDILEDAIYTIDNNMDEITGYVDTFRESIDTIDQTLQDDINRVSDRVEEVNRTLSADVAAVNHNWNEVRAEMDEFKEEYTIEMETLDNNLTSQIESINDSLSFGLKNVVENNYTRKLKQPFYMSTFFPSQVALWEMKQMLDEFKELGLDGIIQPIHLTVGEDSLSTSENIDNVVEAMEYSESIGLPVKYIKFHTSGTIQPTDEFFELYENSILSIMNTLNKFTTNIYVWNENMLTTTNPTECSNVIDHLKAYYGVGVSFHGEQFMGTPDSLISKINYIGYNLYPSCISYNGKKTTYSECVDAFRNDRIMIYPRLILDRYKGVKPIHITESGIRDYYVYYASPASWDKDDINDKSNGEVIANYFNALFEVWNGEFDSITGWYYIYFEKSIKTFKMWTGGNI